MLVCAVEGARGEKSLKRRAAFASLIPNAIDATLREEATRLRLELGINLELARRAAARLAGLDVALGAAPSPIFVAVPALAGEPARVLVASPAEVEAHARVWQGLREALAADPRAEACTHLKFSDPPQGTSRDRASGHASGAKAAAGDRAPAAAELSGARA
jgi:hypothetical protein